MQTYEFRQVLLVDESSSGGIFPRTARALRRAGYSELEYRSALDRWVGEQVPQLKGHILAFYANSGPQLREILPESRWDPLDRQLLAVWRAERRLVRMGGCASC